MGLNTGHIEKCPFFLSFGILLIRKLLCSCVSLLHQLLIGSLVGFLLVCNYNLEVNVFWLVIHRIACVVSVLNRIFHIGQIKFYFGYIIVFISSPSVCIWIMSYLYLVFVRTYYLV